MRFDYYGGILFLALAALFFFIRPYLAKRFAEAKYLHSWLTEPLFVQSLRERWLFLPSFALLVALGLLGLALVDPHTYLQIKEPQSSERESTEGRLFLLAVDRSGSMQEPIIGQGRELVSLKKIDLVKKTLSEFVEKRKGDLLALMPFARSAEVVLPPTQDREALLEEINTMGPVASPELDGTAIGYAIYKGASLLASLREQAEKMSPSPYQIHGSAILLFTDGLQDPNPLDQDNPYRSMELDQAANYAKKMGVLLYIVNVDPSFAERRFEPNIRELKRIAAYTGGKFYLLHNPSDILEVMKEINSLQASRFELPLNPDAYPSYFEKRSYRFHLILGALFALLLFVVSSAFGLADIRYQFRIGG